MYTPVTRVSDVWLSEAFLIKLSLNHSCLLPLSGIHLDISFFFFADASVVVLVGLDFVFLMDD